MAVATAPPWVDLGAFCLQHRDQRLIAPTDSGVFVSSDGGLTWEATTGEQIQRSDCAYQYGRSWQLSDPFKRVSQLSTGCDFLSMASS
jgi:hypothetical protein